MLFRSTHSPRSPSCGDQQQAQPVAGWGSWQHIIRDTNHQREASGQTIPPRWFATTCTIRIREFAEQGRNSPPLPLMPRATLRHQRLQQICAGLQTSRQDPPAQHIQNITTRGRFCRKLWDKVTGMSHAVGHRQHSRRAPRRRGQL